MEFEKFKDIISQNQKKYNLSFEEDKTKKLCQFMSILIQENEKINLTAITEPEDIIFRHFIDSTIIEKYIPQKSKVIDVGTGAGFPGIPIAIYRSDARIFLLDTIKKRTDFLEKVKEANQLDNVEIIWGRAEDFGQKAEYRETFDIAVSRAVAPLNILVEYLLPFIKIRRKMHLHERSELSRGTK